MHLRVPAFTCLLLVLFALTISIAASAAKLSLTTQTVGELIISVDPSLHQEFGLAYPVTYMVSIPAGSTGLVAYSKHQEGTAWTQLPQKTASDYFNGEQVVRFDYSVNAAYVSVGFEASSDNIFIRITDASGLPVPIQFQKICQYYDNRQSVVTISADDWKEYTNLAFVQSLHILRSYKLPVTTGIITGGCTANTWQTIQAELDSGLVEAASHTRTHVDPPYPDPISEIIGSKQDILGNLSLPPLFRKGSDQYVYTWIAPFGSTTTETEALVGQARYLIDRMTFASTGNFTAWDATQRRYYRDGKTAEMGPLWGGLTDVEPLNNLFNQSLAGGTIYHLMLHPLVLADSSLWSKPDLSQHLSYISNRTNVWYVNFGPLYVYHLLQDDAPGSVEIAGGPPFIVTQPAGATEAQGQSATFSVAASGTAPLSYQWQRNGVDIPGATSAQYTTPALAPADSGVVFRCVVSNSIGSATSNDAMLSIVAANALANGNFESGTTPWNFYSNGSASFTQASTGSSGSKSAKISITTEGTNVQIYEANITLQPNTEYKLSFDAYSNTGHDLEVNLGEHSTPYLNYGLNSHKCDLGTSWQSYSITFTTSGFSNTVSDARLMFWLAPYGAAGDVYNIDNVVLARTIDLIPPVASPQITLQPVPQTVTAGQTATFSVSATGTAPLLYQWQNANADIPGATNYSYTTPATTAVDSGALYHCRVTNAGGSVTSADAQLTVIIPRPAKITAQPRDTTVQDGHSAQFAVTATGTAPLTYQWQKNGVDISGSVVSSYAFSTAARGDSGAAFRCIVANSIGKDTSTSAILHVLAAPPVIITQPASRTANAGQTATFAVKATGTAPLTHQWQRDTLDIPGAVDSIYTTAATTSADSGRTFRCVVTNMAGSVTSAGAHLTVITPYPAMVTLDPRDTTVQEGHSAHFTIMATGTAPIAYQWLKNGLEIPGATGSTYSLISTRSDSGAAFSCITSNSVGRDTSLAAVLSVVPAPPHVTVQPVASTVSAGQTATFAVSASGSTPLYYQWQKNSTDVSEARDSAYSTPATTAADSGALFRCIIHNSCGRDTSHEAKLTVITTYPALVTIDPRDTTVTEGHAATFTVAATGTAPISYQWEKNGTDISGAIAASYTIGAPTFADSGATFRCIVFNSTGKDTSSTAILRVLPTPPVFTMQPTSQSVLVGYSASFSVAATGTGTLGYQWERNGSSISGATSATYTTPATSLSDDGAIFRCMVSNRAGSVTSQEAVLTVTSPPVIPNAAANGTFEAGTTGWTFYSNGAAGYATSSPGSSGSSLAMLVTVTTEGTNVQLYQAGIILQANTSYQLSFDAYSTTGHDLDVSLGQHGPPYANYGLANRAFNLTTGWQSFSVTFTTSGFSGTVSDARLMFWLATYDAAGDKYYFDNIQLARTSDLAPTAPMITTQPLTQTVIAGQTATFSVAATGTAPLSYQWQKNSSDISGATGASYTTPVTTSADSGALFRCRVRNTAGSIYSSGAQLLVVIPQPAVVILDPRDTLVAEGKTATFAVSATGNTPLTYQWQKNGANISGATNASYTTSATVHADSGATFRCIVSNGAGKDTSAAALLQVLPAPPVITTQPTNLAVLAGQTATFTVVASGSAPLSYQWQKNGSPISGATAATYTTAATVKADSGSIFLCVVANSAGSVTSQAALLSVNSSVANLLINGGFESGTTGWSFYTNGTGSSATVTPGSSGAGKALQVLITTEGTNVQLYQYGISLQTNTSYQLSFDAYSTTGHDLDVSLGQHGPPFANYGLAYRAFNLTTGWQSFSVTFTTSGFFGTVSDARLMFWLATYDAAGDKYYVDNVLLSTAPAMKEAPEDEPLLPPLASIVPRSFVLEGNFPNPFNPSTVIRYGLPEPATVSIAVYSILGQEVARLSDGYQSAGTFQVTWDGHGSSGGTLSSGIYLCRMVATSIGSGKSYVATKRMVLMK